MATSLDLHFYDEIFFWRQISIVLHKIINEQKLVARRDDELIPPAIDTAAKEATPETSSVSHNKNW